VTASVIRVLEDAVIDQIAAGEVVERPSSVVKELVENSLDAEARAVRVAVRDGGTTWIQVVDDGHGMSPDEARLALLRHATSKLGSAADLEQIRSFGFRGEALPSIASVSNFRLVTRRAEDEEAFELRVPAGGTPVARSIGAGVGTRIEVADLFCSVPARRKFLKRPATEWGHVIGSLGRLALAHPEVHFEVRRDDARPEVWPATSDPLERIAAVLSEEEAASLVAAEREEGGNRLRAYVSAPQWTRPNGRSIRLFVNGRPVSDPVIRAALLQAYRDLLPRGRFPAAVLFLEVPTEAVDVNVHPAKGEVRFAAPADVHALVRHTVRDAMQGRRWLGFGGPSETPRVGEGAVRTQSAGFEFRDAIGDAAGSDGVPASGSGSGWAGPASGNRGQGAAPPEGARPEFASLRVLGQLLASYLVVEGPEGLLLLDQHAAHERVLYERLRAQWLENGVLQQGLLVPEVVSVGSEGVAVLVDSGAAFERLGFEIDAFGETEVRVSAVPALLAGQNPAELVRELIAERGREGQWDGDVRALPAVDRVFASLACHSARRAGDHLEAEEQRGLLVELDSIPWAPTCPHGRPVVVHFERGEIERRFGRR